VPIVEPEVLMDGDHHIDACESATGRTLDSVFEELAAFRLDNTGVLLKVNMVLCGKGCSEQATHSDIAEATVRCLAAHVPNDVPGIVFLSGGQSDTDATVRLNEMNAMGEHPWQLSFSYGRALQAPALTAWGGDDRNGDLGQRALAHRAKMNGLARSGDYDPSMEAAVA
jgi:fructose-bisphosphate aldolase, class I